MENEKKSSPLSPPPNNRIQPLELPLHYNSLKEVDETSHIKYEKEYRIFRISGGNSLYVIYLNHFNTVEHLYWGEYLDEGLDLRFLSSSHRILKENRNRNNINNLNYSFENRIIFETDNYEDIEKIWKKNCNKFSNNNYFNMKKKKGYDRHLFKKLWQEKNFLEDEEIDYPTRRRLENFSWRIMSMISQEDHCLNNGIDTKEIANKRNRIKKLNKLKNLYQYSDDNETDFKNSLLISNNLKNTIPFQKKKTPSESTSSYIITDNISPRPLRAQRRSLASSISCSLNDLNNLCKIIPSIEETTSMSSGNVFLEYLISNQKLSSNNLFNFSFNKKATSNTALSLNNNLNYYNINEETIKSTQSNEYSDYGTGDFRSASFMMVDNYNGSSISPLTYKEHKIYQGRLNFKDEFMPHIKCYDPEKISTLVITLENKFVGIEVDLVYCTLHEVDCLTRRVIFRNVDKRVHKKKDGKYEGYSKVLYKVMSFTLDFEAHSYPFYMTKLCGSWARERYVEEVLLTQGLRAFGSLRGVSSHQINPFVAISVDHAHEISGEVKAFSLIYSGNFLVETEINEEGSLRINFGLHPMGLQWYLEPNGMFETPEAVLIRSGRGLGDISRTMHRVVLDHLIPRNQWFDDNPPVLLNTWEAKYFHINHNNIIEMTKQAIEIGVNMIVIDDGWFGNREDDTCSLGDWIPNMTKFPHGLKGIGEEINKLNCKFGLWFEPEMVSENSNLFSSHPDWYLHVPGRPRQIGRNQMVLDLSRRDVRDYLYNSIASILSSANIEYIKWDMNRPITELYSIACSNENIWQAEISHRYVLGLYELQYKISRNFPHILFENCASGGGRFDLGMLYFSPQIWCSDNTDSLVRLKIQYGTSLLYPARIVGSHVSTIPNHITGNSIKLRTRGFTAMCGTFGYELDLSNSTSVEKKLFFKQTQIYLKYNKIIRWGDFYRIWNPFKISFAAWMYVTRNRHEAIVFAFCLNKDHWCNLSRRIRLQGLIKRGLYEVTEPWPSCCNKTEGDLLLIENEMDIYQLGNERAVLSGAALMKAGIPIKFYSSDDSVVFSIKLIKEPNEGIEKHTESGLAG